MWYVGSTNNCAKRLKQHMSGKGSTWTRKFPPIAGTFYKLLPVDGEASSKFQEDAEVKKLMHEWGIPNVRGGSYSREELSRVDVKALIKELWHGNNGCLRCGHHSHWASKCYAKKDVCGYPIEDDDVEPVPPEPPSHRKRNRSQEAPAKNRRGKNVNATVRGGAKTKAAKAKGKSKGVGKSKGKGRTACLRCGREGHHQESCYARTDVDGNPLEDEEDDSYEEEHSYSEEEGEEEEADVCFRCGRAGHWAGQCYARCDVNGKKIVGT